jgi:hypothetical protein
MLRTLAADALGGTSKLSCPFLGQNRACAHAAARFKRLVGS